jgi:PAS domain-containing protein
MGVMALMVLRPIARSTPRSSRRDGDRDARGSSRARRWIGDVGPVQSYVESVAAGEEAAQRANRREIACASVLASPINIRTSQTDERGITHVNQKFCEISGIPRVAR